MVRLEVIAPFKHSHPMQIYVQILNFQILKKMTIPDIEKTIKQEVDERGIELYRVDNLHVNADMISGAVTMNKKKEEK